MRRPGLADRIWDFAALVLVVGGVGLFAFGRQALNQIAEGTYAMPPGITAVAQTDIHVRQTRIGGMLIAAGVALGIAAALRHRVGGPRPEA